MYMCQDSKAIYTSVHQLCHACMHIFAEERRMHPFIRQATHMCESTHIPEYLLVA